MFGALAFLILSTVVGLIIYAGKRLSRKASFTNSKKKVSLPVSILIGCGVVATVVLVFIVIPTVVNDNNHIKKQDECALSAGFKDRFESESSSVDNLAEKQALYNTCLNAAL